MDQIFMNDMDLVSIIDSLNNLRINLTVDEFELQRLIAEQLTKDDITFTKEFKLGPRKRIDFLVDGGIGIEVKRGKPSGKQVTSQLQKYCSCDEIKSIILVIDQYVNVPNMLMEKKCHVIGLNRLMGIAL